MKATMTEFASCVATQAHGSQTRRNGTPYIEHPRRVAELIVQYKGEHAHVEGLVAAALLHDTLEDTDLTYYDIVENFGYQVASLVMEVTSNPEMKRGVGNKAEYLSFKLKHMTTWALDIKLCDRLDNMRDMADCSDEWKLKYLLETVHILGYLQANRQLSRSNAKIMNDVWERCYEVANQLNVNLNKED